MKKSNLKYIIPMAVLVLLIGILIINRQIKNKKQYEQFTSERQNYVSAIENDVREYLCKYDFVTDVVFEPQLSIETEKVTRSDGTKSARYEYKDYLEIYAYATQDFGDLQKEAIQLFGKTGIERFYDLFYESYDENASFYSECIRDYRIPGTKGTVLRSEYIYFYVVCGNDIYEFPHVFETAYYLNGVYTSTVETTFSKSKEDGESTEKPVKNNSSTTTKPSKNEKDRDIFTDPDDYDDPDEYAEDAWGVDFDDYDDAYDYWEDW